MENCRIPKLQETVFCQAEKNGLVAYDVKNGLTLAEIYNNNFNDVAYTITFFSNLETPHFQFSVLNLSSYLK